MCNSDECQTKIFSGYRFITVFRFFCMDLEFDKMKFENQNHSKTTYN